jgi:omega-6 fatty acid desaturase (delta-12 desaturase)
MPDVPIRDARFERGALVSRDDARVVTSRYRDHRSGSVAVRVTLDAALYCSLVAVTFSTSSPALALLLSPVTGIVIARLFILGHDACHGSLFAGRRANRVVGQLLFLPSLTPYSLWAVGHNVAHHGYTNLRGADYVWTPLSKDEFDALPRWRQRLERCYRGTVVGLGLYYLIELWWKKLYFPSHRHVGARRSEHTRDGLIVTLFFAGFSCLIAILALISDRPVVWAWLVSWAIPFAVWNVLMGFVIYVQHTHPEVAWFRSKREWRWFQAQVRSTPHVLLPGGVSTLLHNIMEHTAHHLDTRVPLRHLKAAQHALESAFHDELRVYHWSWRQFTDVRRRCKLYDYHQHCWLDFDGRATTPPILVADGTATSAATLRAGTGEKRTTRNAPAS